MSCRTGPLRAGRPLRGGWIGLGGMRCLGPSAARVWRLLFDVSPVLAYAGFGDYGDGELGYVLHLLFYELLELFGFGGDYVEEELVVDLESHLRFQFAAGNLGIDF